MKVHEAASQINLIWTQISRTACFRGYRPATVAGTGLLGLATAIVQRWIVPDPLAHPDTYLVLWVAVATVSVVLVGYELILGFLCTDSRLERKLTQQAIRQFSPCLCAGALVTWFISSSHPASVVLLPGLWATCFGLGVFASMPYVTPAVFWVGLYYLLAGSLALAKGDDGISLQPWVMGGTFGIGQLLMAGTLLSAEERRDAQA